jgi:hypothetical protein
MHSRLVTCVVLIAGCALLAIPAHTDSSSQMLGHFVVPTQPVFSSAGIHSPTFDSPRMEDSIALTETLWQNSGEGSRSQTGVAQPSSSCIPIGKACSPHGPKRCCSAPFPHHSFCTKAGFCVMT